MILIIALNQTLFIVIADRITEHIIRLIYLNIVFCSRQKIQTRYEAI